MHALLGKGTGNGRLKGGYPVCIDRLKLESLVSFTVPPNTASRRLMEKLGMTHDPKDDFDHPKLPAGHRLKSMCCIG